MPKSAESRSVAVIADGEKTLDEACRWQRGVRPAVSTEAAGWPRGRVGALEARVSHRHGGRREEEVVGEPLVVVDDVAHPRREGQRSGGVRDAVVVVEALA